MPIRPENRSWYPADWKVRSWFVRFVRARGKCEWCGARHGAPHPCTGAKVILTTAHIFEQSARPHSILNLAALCQKCHNGHDAKMRARNTKTRRKNLKQIEINFTSV